ncbi:ATP-binding cassette, subfamily B [Streptomyces sp. TLI_053]|uniref:ATP-binding cassette domain-containing protein n=1 Tax=Streptomyces sp. TLI_053 TaxID=1855352 RepID=UPI00087D8DDF|nr:ABC transporter ATP-binding protein [Streptomyces sp. TLI_053]SDT83341.1 ATP-binding cassette, subfamily B [Streptomyces sp. TLI_053]
MLRFVPSGILAALVVVSAFVSVLPALAGLVSHRMVSVLDQDDPSGGAVVSALVVTCLVLFLQQSADLMLDPIRLVAARAVDERLRREVGELAISPSGTGHLEDAAIAGRLTMASNDLQIFTAGLAAVGHVGMFFQMLGAVACLVVIGVSAPWLALACLAALLISRSETVGIYVRVNWVWVHGAELARRTRYWGYFARSIQNAKEVRVYGLGDWVADRFRTAALAQESPVIRARRVALTRTWRPVVAGAVAMVAGLVAVALGGGGDPAAVAQNITVLLGALALGDIGTGGFAVEHGRPIVEAFHRLRAELPTAGTHGRRDEPGTTGRPPRLCLERVTFGYPASAAPVLVEATLEVRPGEVLAIVGVNGAGKTTLVKLLTRAHEPQSGRITTDGVGIADRDVEAWRGDIAMVGQDFLRLDLSLRENVEIGAPERLGDDAFFAEVRPELDLDDIVAGLPAGWDTPLSRTRSGGSDLSGGQWQRVAAARAQYALRAGRKVLLLDEPTAHLDTDAEIAVFRRLCAAARGATVILISHRLSTVRLADRIAVLRDGCIGEPAPHERLIAEDGDYARLFALQTRQFTEADA